MTKHLDIRIRDELIENTANISDPIKAIIKKNIIKFVNKFNFLFSEIDLSGIEF